MSRILKPGSGSLVVSSHPYPAKQKQDSPLGGCTLNARGEICLYNSVYGHMYAYGHAFIVVQYFVSVSTDIILSTWQSLFC